MELDRASRSPAGALVDRRRSQLPGLSRPVPGGAAMKRSLMACALCASAGIAAAEITIGVSVSTTGPGTSLGVPISNTFALLPKTIGDEPVRYVLLDDASDPTAGARIVGRLVGEDRADVIIGSSTVPVAIAQAGAASDARIALIALCPIPL